MLGCTPNAISVYGTNGSRCVEFMNYESSFFNVELKSLVDSLNTEKPDATFIYVDAVKLGEDIMAAGRFPWTFLHGQNCLISTLSNGLYVMFLHFSFQCYNRGVL